MAETNNPNLLLFDDDALSQFLLAHEYAAFKVLKKRYGIQCAAVEAVDYEMRQSRRFFASIKDTYEKLLRTEALVILDDRTYPAYVRSANAISQTIALLGTKYHTKIGYGEAYTHAASITLEVPVVSHDRKALAVMDKSGLAYRDPVLTVFDIVVLAHQCGAMSQSECDAMRKVIAAKPNEYLPEQFKHSSFDDGLPKFSPRLVCSQSSRVGGADPNAQALVITPTKEG